MRIKNNTIGGYWKNKKRDSHTLRRLSESKYVKVYQYDRFGTIVRIWDSIKDVAQQVFGDYRVVNGSSHSIIYGILFRHGRIKNKFENGSYWFKEIELINRFGKIPEKINIALIEEEEKQKFRLDYRKNVIRTHVKKYSILHYDENGNFYFKYNSSKHAAYCLRLSRKIIERICNGSTKNPVYNLKYGEKSLQPIDEIYPDYEILPIVRPPKEYQKTRTRYQVIQYDDSGNIVRIFKNTTHCKNSLKIYETQVRALCLGKRDCLIINNEKIFLKYGIVNVYIL